MVSSSAMPCAWRFYAKYGHREDLVTRYRRADARSRWAAARRARFDAHGIASLGPSLDDVYERRRELHAGLAQVDFDEEA